MTLATFAVALRRLTPTSSTSSRHQAQPREDAAAELGQPLALPGLGAGLVHLEHPDLGGKLGLALSEGVQGPEYRVDTYIPNGHWPYGPSRAMRCLLPCRGSCGQSCRGSGRYARGLDLGQDLGGLVKPAGEFGRGGSQLAGVVVAGPAERG